MYFCTCNGTEVRLRNLFHRDMPINIFEPGKCWSGTWSSYSYEKKSMSHAGAPLIIAMILNRATALESDGTSVKL